jgi:protoheme IX farnesyltransferase
MMSETLLLNSSELGATASDWLALLKPRVMTLVVYSGAVGLVVAPVHMNPILALTAILCIAVGAGAAGAINMWYDRDIDAVMRRTASRPVAAGRIEPASALGFGVVLAVGSVLLMAVVANLVAAGILLLSIAFYVFIYTMWLKRLTPQNIVIGGAAGAFPPLLGWAAATGSISVLPVLMFAIIFFWTPPHFWALALYRKEDYARAGIPMLPVVAGDRETRRQILLYTLVLAPLGAAPWLLGYAGPVYGVVASLAGAAMIALALRVRAEHGATANKHVASKQLFGFSILYLFLLFAMLLVDRMSGGLVGHLFGHFAA